MDCKKKLHLFNPEKQAQEIEVYRTKRETKRCRITTVSIEREAREMLAHKISGSLVGIWLLVPEYMRLGSWEMVKRWSGGSDGEIGPRLALQLVNEAALCMRGVRPSRSLCHQGFELANGLPYLATDKEIHQLLDRHTIAEARALQLNLGTVRAHREHFTGQVFALDPYRVVTASARIMPKKKKNPHEPARKVVQNFFCLDTCTGQPVAFTLGSAGKTVTKASFELLEMTKQILPDKGLILADTEHFTTELLDYMHAENHFDTLIPAPHYKNIVALMHRLKYRRVWAGYSLAETPYQLKGASYPVRLIAERIGEKESEYTYNAFITTGNDSVVALLSEHYPERWTIEEFFNFEAALGWNRVQTLNLNILYGRLSLSLIAQAALYQLRQKLPKPYKRWTAHHIADSVFHGIDGDIRVCNDTIVVTIYNVPDSLNLKSHYEHLPKLLEAEGVNPKIPWLYDLKLDFQFK